MKYIINVKNGNMNKTKEQKLPKWFDGTVYEEGGAMVWGPNKVILPSAARPITT